MITMARIGVVGAGRVGAVLSAALRAAGHEVVAAAGQSPETLHRAAALLPGVPVAKPTDVARACDLLLLTVPDDMLENVATTLVGAGAIREGQLVVHTSGRHGLAVLHAATAVGARPVALHPAMTFTGTAVDLDRLAGCVFGVTAGEDERAVVEGLVADLHGVAMWVPEDKRTLYHAGLAHGANHLVTLVSQAMDLLAASGAEDPAATLRPLLTAALDNALASGDAALTGPIVRGDVRTVRDHLAEIATTAPATVPSYVAHGPRHRRSRHARRPSAADPRCRRRPGARRRARPGRGGAAAAPPPPGPVTAPPTAVVPAGPTTPRVVGSRAELRDALAAMAGRVALVPTMGALHAGHAALMTRARAVVGPGSPLVVSVFVNPLQFAPGEDLDRYPADAGGRPRGVRGAGCRPGIRPDRRRGLPRRRARGDRGPRARWAPSWRAPPARPTSAAC